MFKLILFLFITLPLAELYVLIEVGSDIGGLTTIVLCLLTAAIGGLLIRWQGLRTLLDAQQRLRMGEIPADHGFHGILLALSGLMLFTPGFITDSIGFLLLVPWVRNWLIRRMFAIQQRRMDDGIIDIEVIEHHRHLP